MKLWLGVAVGAATAIVAVGAFGVAVGAAARALPDRGGAMTSGNFKTPSGNIVCFYLYGSSSVQPHVVCGIKSRLNPAPPRSGSSCKGLDYQGDRVDLGNTGRASAIPCSGDAGPLRRGEQRLGARLRQDMERWRSALFIGAHGADVSQQERARVLPQPRTLAKVLAAQEAGPGGLPERLALTNGRPARVEPCDGEGVPTRWPRRTCPHGHRVRHVRTCVRDFGGPSRRTTPTCGGAALQRPPQRPDLLVALP